MRAILLLMATTKPEFCAKQKDRKVCREDVCIEVKLLKIFFLRTYDLVLEDSSFSSEKISLVSTMYKSLKYELLLLFIHRKRWECYSFLIKINPDRLDLMSSISYSFKWLGLSKKGQDVLYLQTISLTRLGPVLENQTPLKLVSICGLS